MEWNYEHNLPVEGSYRHHVYDKDALRSYMDEHFPYPEVHSAFELVDWDLEDFFLKKANKDIHGEAFYVSILLDWKKDLDDYWVDMANGFWGIELSIPDTITWGDSPKFVDDTDIFRRLFFCETDTDIWNLALELPQEVTSGLLGCYDGTCEIEDWFPVYLKDPSKAQEMIEYINTKKQNNGE